MSVLNVNDFIRNSEGIWVSECKEKKCVCCDFDKRWNSQFPNQPYPEEIQRAMIYKLIEKVQERSSDIYEKAMIHERRGMFQAKYIDFLTLGHILEIEFLEDDIIMDLYQDHPEEYEYVKETVETYDKDQKFVLTIIINDKNNIHLPTIITCTTISRLADRMLQRRKHKPTSLEEIFNSIESFDQVTKKIIWKKK
jgi:hypothetical protein